MVPKIWTIHIRTDDDISLNSILSILVESADDYSHPNNRRILQTVSFP